MFVEVIYKSLTAKKHVEMTLRTVGAALALTAAGLIVFGARMEAQGRGANQGAPVQPPTAQTEAPINFSGYWVAAVVISEIGAFGW